MKKILSASQDFVTILTKDCSLIGKAINLEKKHISKISTLFLMNHMQVKSVHVCL